MIVSVCDLIKFTNLVCNTDLNVVNISRKHLPQKELSKETISSYFINTMHDKVVTFRNLTVLITKINNTTISDPGYSKRYCEIQFVTCHDFNEYSFLIVPKFATCIEYHHDQENSFQRAHVFGVFDKKIDMHIK